MITLTKIAKLANVSISTASKAFSGSAEVNEETREMIFDIAKQLGCFKRFYNAKHSKIVIAIIAPEFKSAYYSRILSQIQNELDKENCELCVSTTNFSDEKEKELINYYYKHSNADGIIVISPHTNLDDHYEIPVVFIGPRYPSNAAFSIAKDIKPALMKAIQYLQSKGVDSIGFIGESLTRGKLKKFREVLTENNLQPSDDFISITEKRFEDGGYAAMEALFQQQKLPRAIICAYDNMAIGAIRCIYDHGLSVPEDIAILGMDDNFEGKYLNPPLASITFNIRQACRIAAKAVLYQDEYNNESHIILPSNFILRKSFEID